MSRPTSSGTRPRFERPHYLSEVDEMSFDPLMMTGSESAPTVPRPSYSVTGHDPSLPMQSVSPPLESAFSPHSVGTPYSPEDYRGGYKAVPHSDYTTSDPSPMNHSGQEYFDITPDLRDQNLRYGHISPTSPHSSTYHGRNMSDASDHSQYSAELDAGRDGEARNKVQRAFSGLGLSRVLSRRRSSGSGNLPSPGLPERTPVSPLPLNHIPEDGEATVPLDEEHQYAPQQELREGMSNAELRRMVLADHPVRFASASSEASS